VYHGELLEAFVTWVDGWFGETLDVPSTPALAAHLAANEVELREGQRAEVCLAACDWMRHAASQLAEGGVVLVIDYGHEAAELYGPRRMAGSLLTYRQHEVADDPYAAVGNSDITSHVDVTALDRAARAAGLVLVGATTQGPFLARLGLGGLLSELGRQPDIDPMVYLEARSAVVRMLDPRHLGGFRVLAWARRDRDGTTPTLPGFGAGP
jgi:SAM-dependent MidA family methyltransferase